MIEYIHNNWKNSNFVEFRNIILQHMLPKLAERYILHCKTLNVKKPIKLLEVQICRKKNHFFAVTLSGHKFLKINLSESYVHLLKIVTIQGFLEYLIPLMILLVQLLDGLCEEHVSRFLL